VISLTSKSLVHRKETPMTTRKATSWGKNRSDLRHNKYCFCCYYYNSASLSCRVHSDRKAVAMEWGGFVKKRDSGCRGRRQSSQVTKRPDPLTSFLVNGTARFLNCFLRRLSQQNTGDKEFIHPGFLSASGWLLRFILYVPVFPRVHIYCCWNSSISFMKILIGF
jgi:hypothetical protein